MRIMVVIEDDADVRFLIKAMFRAEPRFEITGEAASADEALALISESELAPDLVVLDHSLEGTVTGIELAPQLKQMLPSTKIILFTAYEHLKEEARAEPAIDAFLLKTDMPQLLDLARTLVGLSP